MTSGRVLVVERDAETSRRWKELLEFAHYRPVLVSNPDKAEGPQSGQGYLAALVRADRCGLEPILNELQRRVPNLPVVAVGMDEADAPAQLELPVCAFVPAPLKYRRLIEALERAREVRSSQVKSIAFPVGSSSAIRELDRLINQVSGFDSTVLLQGESGSGKELVARRIHDLSKRRDGPFVPLNCCAVPKELLESELFGHEKGAFTGAITTRIGRFELAHGGTLFLDEIGDMRPEMQAKLLRVLQERVFERVGCSTPRKADVRIIAATHRDLARLVENGEFRQDLFFRLSVFPLRVPALRERTEDLPDLIEDLLRQGRELGLPDIRFTDAALSALRGYAWPGNVRELANLIERLTILYPYGCVDARDLPAPYASEALPREPTSQPELGFGLDLKAHLTSIEKELIRRALEEADGTVARAAKLLNLQRTTLVEKLRKYKL